MTPRDEADTVDSGSVSVVVRSVGERTESCARQLLCGSFAPEQVELLHKVPFSAALRRGWEIGIQAGRPWTLCTDADVLISPQGLGRLLEIAGAMPPNAFELQGRILDKFFGGPKPGGPHLYRTQLLEKAIPYIPPDGVSLRPESYTMKQMAARGYPYRQVDEVIGLHDYEQYYSDIYRKGFQHGQKHVRHAPHLTSLWTRLADRDSDFRIALWGLRAGQIYRDKASLDASVFPQELTAMLSVAGLQEKGALPTNAYKGNEIESIIEQSEPPPEYYEFLELATDEGGRRFKVLVRRLKAALRRTGPVRFVPWFTGKVLAQAGNTLQRWAEPDE